MRLARTTSRFLIPPVLTALSALVGLGSAATPAGALPFTVTSRTDYAVGTGPEWASVADVNNDGYPDVITANYWGNSVSVLLSNGTGGFLPKNDYPAGAGPFTVAAFDINNDQFQDLVVANYAAGAITVLMGNGTGAFPTSTSYPAGANTAVATFGYFNADWNLDIVTANFGANTVSVFLGDGTGAFPSKTDFPTGANPNWVATRDLNADGTWDLVTANYGGNSISVLLGDGSGGFAPKTDYAVGSNPLTLTLNYLDGDNVLDVASADYASNALSVRFGNGSGGFGPATTLTTGTGPVTVTSGDLNIDGNVDLAVCNDVAGTVSTYFGDGTGVFTPKTDHTVGSLPYAVSIRDVTGDGEPDLVACNFQSNSISVLKGNVPGGFAVNDTVAGMTAPDQAGVARSLGDFLGKWTLVDVSAVWCGPCNFIANEAQQVRNTWLQAGTLPFEYVTSLVDGPAGNVGCTQTQADRWAIKYKLWSPVLHADGRPRSANRSWFEAAGTNAYPTLMLVDPTGIIRWKMAGALGGQDLVNQIASIAGVAAPTLVAQGPGPGGPPPPPPVEGPRSVWQTLQGADLEITYGGSTWTGTIGGPDTPGGTSAMFQIAPEGVPGIPNTAYARITASTDSTTDTESITLFIGTADVFQAIELPLAWQVKLKNIAWPDLAPRVLVPGIQLGLSAIYPETQSGTGADVYFQTPIQPQPVMSGNEISFSSFILANVADIPSSTNAFEIGTVQVKHQVTPPLSVGGRGSAVALASPLPNPTRIATTLRWAMARAGQARLDVVDVTGRHVRGLHAGSAEAGEHTTTWDLRGDDGTRVAPGLYFVRFAPDGEPVRSTRMVVLK